LSTQTIDLLAKGLANPFLHLVQRMYLPVYLFCFDAGKGNGIHLIVKIRPFTPSPKPETDSNSSRVQIITMMSITVDCRGKVRRLKQKPLQRLRKRLLPQQHALYASLPNWMQRTKFRK
jgi:hypothetical protein